LIIGHEYSGVIEKIGSKVKGFKIGDKITSEGMWWCGECDYCRAGFLNYCRNLKELGFSENGAFAEYAKVKAKYCWKINNLSQIYKSEKEIFKAGALIEPFSVGYFGIWGIEPLKNRSDLALKLGADEVVNPTTSNLKDTITKLTNGLGGSVVVEASGNDKAIASIFDVAGHSAGVRLIGHSVGRKVLVKIGLTIWKTLSITGSGGIKNFMPRTIRFMERIRNEFDFKSLISHRYPFKEIDKAFDEALNDKKNAFKVMLNFKIINLTI